VLNCLLCKLCKIVVDSSAETDPLIAVPSGGPEEPKVFLWDLRNMGGNTELEIPSTGGTRGHVSAFAADPLRAQVYIGTIIDKDDMGIVDCWDCTTGTSLIM
jgi:hypothetical protein